MNTQMMQFFMNMMRSGGNPEQTVMQLLQQQDNPMAQNLYQLAQRKDARNLEQIARNLCQQRGIDFDTEFRAFQQQLRGFK